MAMAKFTVDTTNKLFICKAGVVDFDVQVDLYSDAKEHWLTDSTAIGFDFPIRSIGGDPVTATQFAGDTYFLIAPWKIRPDEANHTLNVAGNLFTDPAGSSPFVDTVGAYNVRVETFVSNLVDSSLSQADLNQLLQTVYVDVASGVAGTGDDVGTPTNPSNNLTDAIAIATSRTLKTFTVRGNLTIDQDVSGFNFHGENGRDETAISLGGYDFDLCNFVECSLTGTMTGAIQAERCRLQLVSGVAGTFEHCGFYNDFTLAAGSVSVFTDCYSAIAGNSRVTVTFGGTNTLANFRNYSGGIELDGMTTGCACSVDGDPAKLVAGSGNTAGELLYRGSTTVDLTGIGGGVSLVDDRFSSLDKNVDGTLTAQDALKYLLAMAAGEFDYTDAGSSRSYTFKDRSGANLFTLEVNNATGDRTRTSG